MNLFLKNAITESKYTNKKIVELIKDSCGITREDILSQRIHGRSEFKESEIKALCKVLKKYPCEIFFNNAFTLDKPNNKKSTTDKTKEERQ